MQKSRMSKYGFAMLLAGVFLIGAFVVLDAGDAEASDATGRDVSVDDPKSRLQGYLWADGIYDDDKGTFTIRLRKNKADHFRPAAEAHAVSVKETFNDPFYKFEVDMGRGDWLYGVPKASHPAAFAAAVIMAEGNKNTGLVYDSPSKGKRKGLVKVLNGLGVETRVVNRNVFAKQSSWNVMEDWPFLTCSRAPIDCETRDAESNPQGDDNNTATPVDESESAVSVDDPKARLYGYLWGEGNYDNATGKFTLRLRKNKADHFRPAAKAHAVSVKETFNSPFYKFEVDLGRGDWLNGVPDTSYPAAFAAAVIMGEGNKNTGLVYDGPSRVRREAFASLLNDLGVETRTVNRNVFAERSSWNVMEDWPFLTCSRAPVDC